MFVDMQDKPLSVDAVIAHVTQASAGGIDVFIGVVRDHHEGRRVEKLEYQAYGTMAVAEMKRIAEGIEAEIPHVRVAAVHRVGTLDIGDIAIVCAASAPHREEAFRACRLLIDRIKESVPIWKREHGPDGALWIGWVDARCRAHGHTENATHPQPEE